VLVHGTATCTRDDAVFWGFSRSSLDRLGHSPACAGSSSWTHPRSRAIRGSSARSRRADQAAWSRRSTSSAAGSCGRSPVSASGACARSANAAWLTVPVVMGRASAGASLTVEARLAHGERSWNAGGGPAKNSKKGGRFGARPRGVGRRYFFAASK